METLLTIIPIWLVLGLLSAVFDQLLWNMECRKRSWPMTKTRIELWKHLAGGPFSFLATLLTAGD